MKNNKLKKMQDLILKAIKIKSIESSPKEILKSLEIFKKEFSSDFIIKDYLFQGRPMIVLSNTKSKKVDFILAGHSDVVPGPDELFQPKTEGDILKGRGAYDMKAPLIAALFALRQYLKDSDNLKVAVFITTDEEKDGLSSKYLVKEIGYQAKFAILPDGGSEKELITVQKGFLQLKLITDGVSAHASTPFEGDNPIHHILTIYNELLKKFPLPTHADDWKTSICITKINADAGSINLIPKTAITCLDIRYVNTIHVKKIINIIKKTAPGINIKIIAENELLAIDKNNQHVATLKNAMNKFSDKPVKLSRECSTSDAVFLSEQGIPSVLFRPKGGGTHQYEEWVSQESLVNFYKIILNFLKKYNIGN